MAEYVAMYKCRLCGKTFSDSLISEEEAEKCLMAFEKGKTYYLSHSGRNNVSKHKGHYDCEGGSFGWSDFQGFKKVGE